MSSPIRQPSSCGKSLTWRTIRWRVCLVKSLFKSSWTSSVPLRRLPRRNPRRPKSCRRRAIHRRFRLASASVGCGTRVTVDNVAVILRKILSCASATPPKHFTYMKNPLRKMRAKTSAARVLQRFYARCVRTVTLSVGWVSLRRPARPSPPTRKVRR